MLVILALEAEAGLLTSRGYCYNVTPCFKNLNVVGFHSLIVIVQAIILRFRLQF